MNIFKKLLFLLKKPKVILIVGKGRSLAKEAILRSLGPCFKNKKILILESDLKKIDEVKEFKFFLKKSDLSILVITHIGDISADKDFFAGEQEEVFQIRKLAKILPKKSFLILNFDDEAVRMIKNESSANVLTYGFQKRADLQATDLNINSEGANFKINYQGSIVPFWIESIFEKKQVYGFLAAIAAGIILGLNLVEMSQEIRELSFSK